MGVTELVFIGFVIFGGILGYSKGLLRQISTLAGLFLGYFAAGLFLSPVHKYLVEKKILSSDFSTTLTFILLILVIYLSVKFLSKGIENMLKAIGLNFTNRIAGFLLGGFKFLLIGLFVSYLLIMVGIISEKNTSQNFMDGVGLFRSILWSYLK
ncbi:CvpA family protein [Apibacter muscae]|uniref:CvpA family protein n=1 Tax=Apibacter muscae TaxID=2509004 RepID=UPI0011AC3DBD|nr:CvpA family protein [Apibacter muscae]TWP27584.1 CvpA family protein [Apibacter muscae]